MAVATMFSDFQKNAPMEKAPCSLKLLSLIRENLFYCSPFIPQRVQIKELGSIVGKLMNLIQDLRKLWFHIFTEIFGKAFFSFFFKIDFFCVKVLPNIGVEQLLGVEK